MVQEKTIQIIKEDYDRVQAYARVFGVEMPVVQKDGSVSGLPGPIHERYMALYAADTVLLSWEGRPGRREFRF